MQEAAVSGETDPSLVTGAVDGTEPESGYGYGAGTGVGCDAGPAVLAYAVPLGAGGVATAAGAVNASPRLSTTAAAPTRPKTLVRLRDHRPVSPMFIGTSPSVVE